MASVISTRHWCFRRLQVLHSQKCYIGGLDIVSCTMWTCFSKSSQCSGGVRGVRSNLPFLSLMRCKRWEMGIRCCGKSNARLRGKACVQPVALFQQGTCSSRAFLYTSSGPGCTSPSISDFHAGSGRLTCICRSWRLAEHTNEPPSQNPAYGPGAIIQAWKDA